MQNIARPRPYTWFLQINPDLCIGCGGCESICPVRPMRAIIIKSNVEHKFVEKPKEEEIKEIAVDDFGF